MLFCPCRGWDCMFVPVRDCFACCPCHGRDCMFVPAGDSFARCPCRGRDCVFVPVRDSFARCPCHGRDCVFVPIGDVGMSLVGTKARPYWGRSHARGADTGVSLIGARGWQGQGQNGVHGGRERGCAVRPQKKRHNVRKRLDKTHWGGVRLGIFIRKE